MGDLGMDRRVAQVALYFPVPRTGTGQLEHGRLMEALLITYQPIVGPHLRGLRQPVLHWSALISIY